MSAEGWGWAKADKGRSIFADILRTPFMDDPFHNVMMSWSKLWLRILFVCVDNEQ